MFWQYITLAGNFAHCKKKGDQQSHELQQPVSRSSFVLLLLLLSQLELLVDVTARARPLL